MAVLRALSPLVEPLSLDEAFVDLAAATRPLDSSRAGLRHSSPISTPRSPAVTGGLTASVGVALEVHGQGGQRAGQAGRQLPGRARAPRSSCSGRMPVGVIPGVGPVSQDKLRRIGFRTIADLQPSSPRGARPGVGQTHAQALPELAFGRDDRPIEAERETKSISVEDTSRPIWSTRPRPVRILDRDARQVALRRRPPSCSPGPSRSRSAGTTSRPTPDPDPARRRPTAPELIARRPPSLLSGVDIQRGGSAAGGRVAGLTEPLQEDLFAAEPADRGPTRRTRATETSVGASESDEDAARGRAGPRAPTSCTTSTAGLDLGGRSRSGDRTVRDPRTPHRPPIRTFADQTTAALPRRVAWPTLSDRPETSGLQRPGGGGGSVMAACGSGRRTARGHHRFPGATARPTQNAAPDPRWPRRFRPLLAPSRRSPDGWPTDW